MNPEVLSLARRAFLTRITSGFAGVALTQLLADDFLAGQLAAAEPAWSPGKPQFAPKAKQVLQIFCPGAASHIDLWDYKPELEKRDGQPLPGEENTVSFQG